MTLEGSRPSGLEGSHTPGPWKAVNRSGAGWQIDAVLPVGFKIEGTARVFHEKDNRQTMMWTLRENSMTIQIGDERWVQFETGTWQEMQAANARLIAAAPDLLAALNELSVAVNLRALHGQDHVPSMRRVQDANVSARDAIAKATSPSSAAKQAAPNTPSQENGK